MTVPYSPGVLAWVTGATGFVGSRLVERLSARGDEVVALVRPCSLHRAPRGARIVEGVLPDVGALAALPQPDVVFHCAAVIDGHGPEAHAVHVDATARLADAAPRARFVHLSTTDVLPLSSRVPLSEAAACAPRDTYGHTKLEGERRLLAARPDAVVLRPPGIYGPHATRDVVLHMAQRIERKTFFYVGDGSARRSWVFVETLVDAMLHTALHAELAGTFLVDDGRSVSRRELAEIIARILERPARFPRVPVALARSAGWLLERTLAPLGIRPPLTSESVRFSASSLALDTSRLKKTGFRARFSLHESIAATVDWARATGRLSP